MFRLKIDSELADCGMLNAWQLTSWRAATGWSADLAIQWATRGHPENPRDRGYLGLHASLLSACEAGVFVVRKSDEPEEQVDQTTMQLVELIELGARLQVLETETELSHAVD